jgi:hypothetical protein
MEALLTGRSIRDIARERRVRVGCVYAQRSKAILKLRKLLAEETVDTQHRLAQRQRPRIAVSAHA